MANTRRVSSTHVSLARAVSSIVGSRPSSWSNLRDTFRTRDMVSTICTGISNRPALVGHGTSDRLANPPSRVGAEFESTTILELVHRSHQAGVTFLNQIQEAQASVAILLGNGDDESQVPF